MASSVHSGREAYSLEQLLLVELGDVVGHRGHAARLRPADARGALAAGVQAVPQGRREHRRAGAVAVVLDGPSARAVEDEIAEDAVAGGRDAGDDRGVARPGDGREDRRHARGARARGPSARAARAGGGSRRPRSSAPQAVDAQHDRGAAGWSPTSCSRSAHEPGKRASADIMARLHGHAPSSSVSTSARLPPRAQPTTSTAAASPRPRSPTGTTCPGPAGPRPTRRPGGPPRAHPARARRRGPPRAHRRRRDHRPGADPAPGGRGGPAAPSRDPVARRAQRGGGGAARRARRSRGRAHRGQPVPRLLSSAPSSPGSSATSPATSSARSRSSSPTATRCSVSPARA